MNDIRKSAAQTSIHARDLRGYGLTPPDPQWPGGTRVALNFVLNFEEGSEYSFQNGDNVSEGTLLEVQSPRVPAGMRDLAAESMYEYGSRVGFWRLKRIFDERDVPVTVFACAQALEMNPEAAEAIAASNWDLCCHGYRWNEQYLLSESEQRLQINRAVVSLEKLIGRLPLGWYCRYAPSPLTRKLVIEHGGFLYDSDAYNDDLPYWNYEHGVPHLVIPYSLATNDTKILRGGLVTGSQFFEYLRETLDALVQEGKDQPRLMNVGLHMRIVGHPGRAAGLARFLDYARSLPEVWICRREDIARHWLEVHPASASVSMAESVAE